MCIITPCAFSRVEAADAETGVDGSAPASATDQSWPSLRRVELRNTLHVPGADHTVREPRWDDNDFAAHMDQSVRQVKAWTGVNVHWTP